MESMGFGAEFESVMQAARAGTPWALAALYRDLHPSVLRYLRVQDPGRYEDIGSEVWLSVAAGLARFKGGESDFRRWVFTIARRRLVDARRSERRERDRAATQWLERSPFGDNEEDAMEALATDRAFAR